MNKVNYCVNCSSVNVNSHNGGLHRFVVDRMLGLERKAGAGFVSCKILHCADCDFIATDERFTSEEERRYYKNYMKEEYVNHRFLYENSKDHLLVFSTEDYKKTRRVMLHHILSKTIPINDITSVLDFGGDTGELIPESLALAKKYLFEIEDRAMPSDVIPIKSAADTGPIDLIICGHTFEHVSYPDELIKQIKTFMNPDTYLYIEVPHESHGDYFHEHINQYNLTSLNAILEKNDMTAISAGEISYPKYIDRAFYIIGKLK